MLRVRVSSTLDLQSEVIMGSRVQTTPGHKLVGVCPAMGAASVNNDGEEIGASVTEKWRA